MKLLLPISAILLAAGGCCCCGGDVASELTELGVDVPPELQQAAGGVAEGDAPAVAAPSTGSLVGSCGRFKTLTTAPGTSVQTCIEGGGDDSIVLQSKSTPEDSCKAAKAWATGAGYTVEFETNAMGTSAITLVASGERMAIACGAAMGQTIVSISLSPA